MDFQRTLNDFLDRHPRVERRERILKDDLNLGAIRPHGTAVELEEIDETILGVEENPAFHVHAGDGVVQQIADRFADGGFAAARFSDEAERLSFFDGEADPVDGAHFGDFMAKDAPPDRVADHEFLYVEQRFTHARPPPASDSGRIGRPSADAAGVLRSGSVR